MQLIEWVLNPIPVNKKKGTIHICMEFHDLNKACLKENFPTPFIDHIVDEFTCCEVFSFMDIFLGYNQIQIKPEDQHKMDFICPWGTFAYRKMHFGLKNVGDTFQRAMSFAFHNLKHIVEVYLDDLESCSCKGSDHPTHLPLIFERCHYYQIHLDPNKCSFYMASRNLLGFIVSTRGIMVDPLKVEAIVQFPPPCIIPHLKSLKGKANFLHRFVANYAEITKGFMCLLKKRVPFCWDEVDQHSFEAFKCALTSTPLLSLSDYGNDFLLYLDAIESTIDIVLVQ
jgi:hypothetical protein